MFGWVGAAWDAAKGLFSQDQAQAPTVDGNAFKLGGDDYTVGREYATMGGKADGARTRGNDAAIAGSAAQQQYNQTAGAAATKGVTSSAQQNARGGEISALAGMTGSRYANAGIDAQARKGPQIDQSASVAARNAQLAALGGVSAQTQQNADTSALRGYYDRGMGPSAAQAQLAQATQQNMGNALALARSGRVGNDAGAERQAMAQNAATQQQAANQSAALRAQEEQAWRQQQLQAITAEQQARGQSRDQQLAALGMQQNALAGMRQQDIGLAQSQAQIDLARQAQNDQYGLGMSQLAEQARNRGTQAELAYAGLGNQSQANANQYALGLYGLGNQSQAQGQAQAMGWAGLGLSYDQQQQALLQQERNAMAQAAALKSGQQLQVNLANSGYDAQRDAAFLNMVGSLGASAAGKG